MMGTPEAFSDKSEWRSLLLGGSLLLGVASVLETTATYQSSSPLLLQQHRTSTASEDVESSTDDAEEEDPYDNLPDEDEETDCGLCITFRQGPCRPYWRKLERCFKDHEGEDNETSPCMKYFWPHQQCLSGYSNLYQLISLDLKQDLIRDAQLSVSKEERRPWESKIGPLVIDWSRWQEYQVDLGAKAAAAAKLTPSGKDEGPNEPLVPLWKRVSDDTEPLLVSTPVDVPRRYKDSDKSAVMILKLAFCVDQNGMAIGVTYNNEYGEFLDKARAQEKNDETKEDGEAEDDAKSTTATEETADKPMELEFHILPGVTEKVRIYALYTENPTTADPAKEILDVIMLQSEQYTLKDQ